jgi:O-acetyl-ADP-ribose deacetylase (regulator of RNase III)
MTLHDVRGDLISLAKLGWFDVIAHGCNCFCTMGAGVAKQIARSFPEAAAADKNTMPGDRHKLGTVTMGRRQGLITVNCYTQFEFGGGEDLVDYDALRRCMKILAATFPGKTIGMPHIGAGLAGGDWPRIRKIIEEELAPHTTVCLVEYDPAFKNEPLKTQGHRTP